MAVGQLGSPPPPQYGSPALCGVNRRHGRHPGPRLFEPPEGSFFLLGPRGSGKSTWLRKLCPDARWIDLLDPGLYHQYLVDPGSLSAELLRAHGDYRSLYDELAYWAPAEAKTTEVDFVLVRGKEKIAIEAKAGARFRSDHLTGLRAIADLPGLARRIVVYTGTRELLPEPGIEVLPVRRFLEELERGF